MKNVRIITPSLPAVWYAFRSRVHIRHWRGKGIHSPFMYGMMRHVFMPRKVTGNLRPLYEALCRNGLGKRQATLLQNLYTYCRLDDYMLWKEKAACPKKEHTLYVVPSDSGAKDVADAAARAAADCGILAIPAPHRSIVLKRAAKQILKNHPCVSVDRIDMLLCFFDPKLQPQHYRI